MKKVFAIAIAAALMTSAGSVAAQEVNWNYIGGGYQATNINPRGFDSRSFDSWYGEGSAALGSNGFIQGRYTKGMDADFPSGVAAVSLGLRTGLDERTDLYGKVTAAIVVQDRQDFDKYNYSAEVGVRAQAWDRVELRGGVGATEPRDARFDSIRWYGTVGAEYALTPSLRLGADVRGKSRVLEGQIGLRAYF